MAFVQKHPLSESQIESLLPIAFTHLDQHKIPRQDKALSSSSIPLLSLRCLVILVLKYIHHRYPLARLCHSLTAFWPHLWKWLEAISSRYIEDIAVNIDDRITAKAAVLNILLVFADQPRLSALPNSNPEVIPLLLRLWALEASQAESDTSANGFHICASMVLDRFLVSFCDKTRLSWIETILKPMGGNADDVASFALTHLRYHSRQERTDITKVSLDVRMLNFLSNYDPLCRAFLAQLSVPTVTRVLCALVLGEYSEATSLRVGIGISYCFEYLCGALQTGEGCVWIVQALDEQLICAMLKCSPWHKHLDEHFAVLLSLILPRNLVHRPVVLAMARALKQVHAKGLSLKMGHGQLGRDWAQLKSLAENRIALLKNGEAKQYMVGSSPICHNAKVQPVSNVLTRI
jgi:hypothetical protein